LLDVADNSAAVRVARGLRAGGDALVDVVPGHRTVLVTWDVEPSLAEILALAEAALEDGEDETETRIIEIRVGYGGMDLGEVARLASLSPEEVVARHVAADYRVAFLGFAPGFAYLLGGDDRLNVPRLAEPRERVPAGTVAIGGPYTGIYPRASPGGWRLIGRTTATLFDAMREQPALLAAGDRVRLVRE
jgi:KipI family sensor histidine kinase inhibitor